QNRLFARLTELKYDCWRTRHDGTVEPIDLSTGIESHADLKRCDYLFLPVESAEEFLKTADVTIVDRSPET
ncbi:MAG: hypothetical protein AAF907_16430, partial [Planctomycetota bacterium]